MPTQNAENLVTAADATPGLWTFLGVLVSGFFGFLAKIGWDRRRVASSTHGTLRQELSDLREMWATHQKQQNEQLEKILQAQSDDAVDRAAFRASIEATMATKGDVHAIESHLSEKLEGGLGAVHTRINDHVRDYHPPRAA